MNASLTEILTEMKASYPYNNPHCQRQPLRTQVPTVRSNSRAGDTVLFAYQEHGAKVVRANLIYTCNGGDHFEEWFRQPATLLPGGKVSAQLPQGTSHYLINLIDENNFLVSYPTMTNDVAHLYSTIALPVE